MFRRKRSASQHRHQHQLSSSNTQNAQSAATRAFIQSQPSSSNLSSAAAAAALRSLTPTPTPVENVQTKRMLQRKSSISSQPAGSPTLRPSSRNGLRRSNSSASMSARTFRDQSPGRPSSSYSTMSTPAVAPPLPSIPTEFSGRRNQSRRSVSLGPSALSPSPRTQPTEARSIRSPVTVPDSPRVVASPGAGSGSPLHQRSESRNSINFSYPMNSRTNSPTIPSGFPDRQDAAASASASLNKRSSAHYNKNKAQAAAPGSPARNSLPVITALAAAQAVTVTRNDEPNTPPVSSRPARQPPAIERSPSRSPATLGVKQRPVVTKSSAVAEDRPAKEHSRPSPTPSPSPASVPPAPAPAPTPIPAPASAPASTPVKEQENQPLALRSKEPPRAPTPPVAEKVARTPPVSPPQVKPTAKPDGEAQSAPLPQPSSPSRSAHFSSQLAVISLPGDQLHQPPARSISPAKSALKNRNSSLSPDGRLSGILRPGPSLSELSDATSVASDDGARPNHRKKPVKVSFDDEAEIVGVAASPPTSPEDVVPESPPGRSKSKTSWFHLHKRKSSPLRSTDGNEFDEVLKPRAALPSFGSIRGNKDGARAEATVQHDVDDDSVSESDDDFPNGHAINNIISRASEANVPEQEQSYVAQPAVSTDAAAKDDAEKEAIDDYELEPGFFQKTQLSPLVEVPSDQNLPLSDEPDLEMPDIPGMPDITLHPATPDPEKGRTSLERWDSPEEYPRQSIEVEPEETSQLKGKRRDSADNDSSSSVYSDAEEDLDGSGFGSINAIVDHEKAHSEPGVAVTTPDDETRYAERDPNATGIPETCQIARVQTPVQEQSKSPAPSSPGLIEPLPLSSPPAQSEENRHPVQRGVSPSSTVPVEVYSIASARDYDPKEVDARPRQVKSNSPNAQRAQRQSQKRPEPSAPTTRKEVNSPDLADLEANGGAHMPRRQLSNGSDSSSSFKRARRGSRGGIGMRRTLRSQESSSVPPSSTRVAAPVDPPPMPSGLGAGTMRTTLRNNTSRKEKPSFFSTGKTHKGKFAKGASTPFSSRFPDSESDSDDGVQNRRLQRPGHRSVRSMSDNDMRPVRGIPRRKDAYDGDSTELEDSSDGERRPSSAPRGSTAKASARQPQSSTVRDPALAAVAKSRGMTEDELEEMLNRGSRKPSLLNRLSMRKSKPVTQRGKLQLSEALSNGTIPEHPQAQVYPAEAANNSPRALASSSKLTKKSLQKSSPGDTWPLSSEQAEPVDSAIGSVSSPSTAQNSVRPQTPNGRTVNGNEPVPPEQTFGITTECTPANGQNQDKPAVKGNRASDVVIEGSGRKKRFQRLKKAFGIGK
ncbi:uncharacterized protein DSM5745_07648 [Aspergillus mulundensis]|uniref:Uncharacterized protein n=1 Tax=Aspergillus mulundensis TaxID=1810919 RepID=A0A3D8REV2_9EURO|nr:Uncharacterized protein DSM5745_07648 [Aspergillus mulundensis]RDW72476.1 Uncharacterized protein DSM5745_07648 [Aspergillus mulundensis]